MKYLIGMFKKVSIMISICMALQKELPGLFYTTKIYNCWSCFFSVLFLMLEPAKVLDWTNSTGLTQDFRPCHFCDQQLAHKLKELSRLANITYTREKKIEGKDMHMYNTTDANIAKIDTLSQFCY